MTIWLDQNSKVLVQGMTGSEGRKHTQRMIASGTRVVAGVTPGKGGQTVTFEEDPVPVYDSVAEAKAATGANGSVIFVPAAFTAFTGRDHWVTLLRARAIETGCFVFAAAQAGLHENKRETYGHSLIIDPWGRVLADGDTWPNWYQNHPFRALRDAQRAEAPSAP